jgi:hypothetical protein
MNHVFENHCVVRYGYGSVNNRAAASPVFAVRRVFPISVLNSLMLKLRFSSSLILAMIAGAALSMPAFAQPGSGQRVGGAASEGVSAFVSTLTAADASAKAPSAEGFLQRWLILEPIASSGVTESVVQGMVKKEPYMSQLMTVPRDGEKLRVGETELVWHAMDTKLYNVNLYHFGYGLNKQTANVMFWVVTVVNCPEEMPNVRLAIGSNAASVWWLNEQEVIGIYGDRQTVVDDGVSKRLTLKKGANIVRAAIVNAGGATDFCARFLDSGDKPITTITTSLGGGTK